MKKLILLLLLTLFAYSENIERYIVNLYINSSGELRVVEDILYNFGNLNRHGIYRDIPKNKTIIKNITVLQNSLRAKVKITHNKDYVRIRVGDANSYVTGLVNYKISYNISGYVVRNSGDINRIIVDLIGTGWRVPIRYAKVVIHMPDILLGRSIVTIYSGKFGSKNTLNYKTIGNKIETVAHNLPPHNGITVELKFDKKLIKANSEPSDEYYKNPIYYLLLAPLLGLFYYFGKKFNIFESIGSISPKYRPPKDLTVLESGLLKDNFVDFKELKPAIIELANLGYIKIKDIDGELYLEKLQKDVTPLSNDQKILLNAIFKNVTMVNSRFLEINQEDVESIRNVVHKSLVDKGLFSSSVRKARDSFLFTSAIVALFTFGALLFFIFKDTGLEFIFPIVIVSIFVGVGFKMLVSSIKNREYSTTIFSLFWIGFSSLFLYNVVYSEGIFISIVLMVVIIAIGIFYIYKHINTLSFKGMSQKRYLLGLKEFIAKAQKDKIDYFLKEDKHFLDKLLPYAILFGLNRHWLNLYQELNADLPTWYDGDISMFDRVDFDITPYDPTPSTPSIDSSDFGSFGGFSGGGIGGGGGDSW